MADEDEESCRAVSFDEIHFISIPSQTNVYGLSKFIDGKTGRHTLLLSSLKGTVISICSPSSFTPSSLSSSVVPFKNLQGSVDIVSIGTFDNSSGLIIGIAFVKDAHTDYQQQFLNLYYSNNIAADLSLGSISDNCQTIELDFVPFHLFHTTVFNSNLNQTGVFLLSGSDEKIHVFAMNDSDRKFTEYNLEEYFPEFLNLPGSVIWMDICHDRHNKRRISALACQNGFLKVIVVNDENEIHSQWTAIHDGPVSSVRIFTFKSTAHHISEELDDILPENDQVDEISSCTQSFHVLVTGVIEPSVIYQDILKCGLSALTILPESEKYDCVVCSFITDIDWDGNNEILLGTYGQELLVYKLSMIDENEGEVSFEILQSKLCWRKRFSQPLFAIDYVDVTDDGVREIVVASSKGLHVLQHRFSEITKRFQDAFGHKEHSEEYAQET